MVLDHIRPLPLEQSVDNVSHDLKHCHVRPLFDFVCPTLRSLSPFASAFNDALHYGHAELCKVAKPCHFQTLNSGEERSL